jgi:flagellar biosynthesis/type III secretory pathway M-ring protein FliF/YscJ
MSQSAQLILAIGAAVFLVGLIFVAIIWAVRCRPDSSTYRNPLLVLTVPAVVGLIYVTRHMIH